MDGSILKLEPNNGCHSPWFCHNPTMMKTQSIRELRALQAKALEAYHAEHRRLEAEIQAIRTVRGTKLKEKVFESYHEPGRSRERFPGGQLY
jgi:hypothetical protein